MILTPRGLEKGSLYALLQALVNRALVYPNARVGTTTTRVRVDAFSFGLEGQLYTKAATDPVDDFDNAFTNTGASEFCKVRLEISAAGVVTGRQGPIAAAQALAPIPPRTPGLTTLCIIEIPASFTFGTTSYASATFRQGDPDLGIGDALPANRGIAREVYYGS